MDFAYSSLSGDRADYKGTGITQLGYTASTSAIGIKAIEDLGGGLKSEAFYELDPRVLATDGGALGRHQSYVGLSGGFGSLKLGAPNSLGLAAFGATSPLGTGIGSGYAPGGNGTGATAVVSTRWSRSAQYSSPSFSGLTASMTYATGNDETTAPAASATANGMTMNRNAVELGLTYANGPLTVAFVNIQNGELKNGATNGAGATANSKKSTANVLGANYVLGNTTLYAAYMTGDSKIASGSINVKPIAGKGYRLAAKHTIGQIDLMASYQEFKINNEFLAAGVTSAQNKDAVTGLRADYNLSKTSAVYIGYESWNTFGDKNTRTATSVGIKKAF